MTVSVPRIEKLLAEAKGLDVVVFSGCPETTRALLREGVDALPEFIAAVKALEEIAGRSWRDEGGRIAAAIARDGLAPFSFEEQA